MADTTANIDPIDALRERGRRLVVGPRDEIGSSSVYAIVHWRTPELAAMPGYDALAARRDLELRQDGAAKLELAATDEERAEAERYIAELDAQIKARVLDALVGTPERAVEHLERCRRVVCSAVVAIGLALEGAIPGPYPMGTHPSAICKPLTKSEDPLYLRKVTITADRSGELSVLDIPTREVFQLATHFAAAFSGRSMVGPLPGGPTDASVGRRPRDSVPRHEAVSVHPRPGS